MKTLSDIPFELDLVSIAKTVHVEPDSPDGRTLAELIETARRMARPKALYTEAFIDAKGAETVTVDGITFTSRMLRANLEPIERVFPFIATCGHEMDTADLPAGDFLVEFWWDAIKAVLLGTAIRHLNEHLKHRYALGRTASMSPGSGDVDVWPIEQQAELFALLGDVKGQIGVELTESFLMKPNKTVSGICFATEVDFHSCQVCRRKDCPSRGAPFDPHLWDQHQHG
ncbi:vitamin B12 dependent-methionine synthase activation domain-containing protein [Anaerobaca lacustris]|uniref:Vitamin B12 dependent-methionine synthase activation domain-containing protein n=1 Tax=Anaerobaca lacustris TaxID=3044600 RepID=A0AAW6U0F7_9BACT|nr:vitamin B12 dependent-methionine synthase activation domain-containing protein [Sedimentisphaerales bacterium M17dextr]